MNSPTDSFDFRNPCLFSLLSELIYIEFPSTKLLTEINFNFNLLMTAIMVNHMNTMIRK